MGGYGELGESRLRGRFRSKVDDGLGFVEEVDEFGNIGFSGNPSIADIFASSGLFVSFF
jgi:hypothetical protein